LDVVQVSYAPSARIWAASRRRPIKAPAGEIEALIVADPQPQSEGTPPLAGAREEAGSLATLISSVPGCVSALAGEEAILSEVLDALRRREATLTHIHFACHGLAELADPQISGILLAYGARLMTRDLLNPEFVRFTQLRLVVLAACRTALVGTELPDEAVGLPSAWLQAGAQGVLASLWPISDSWTVALMTKFYELHLLDEREPVEALWLAQRWLRGLPSWREDCRAAGAVRAAEGPEANEIVFEQGKVRVRGRRIDDGENHEAFLVEGRGMAEEGIKVISGRSTENQDTNTSEQQWFWEDAWHWAAFAIYGA
jgi:CHAT domain-containing protein